MGKVLTAIRSGHPGSLFSAFLHFDVSFMVWVLLGALGVFIAQDLNLTATQKGFMVAVPLLGGAIFRVVVGFLADRFGPKKTGIGCLILVMLPLLWGWLGAGTFSEVLALGLLLGVAGASFAVAMPLASRWYPPESQGIAMGIAGAGNSGTIIAVLLAPRLAPEFGWHGVFGLALLPVLVTLAVFTVMARETPDLPTPVSFRQAARIFREPDLWWFSLFYSITFGGFVGLASFLGIFFYDQYRVDRIMAGNLTALCVIAGSGFRPLGGYLADRLGGLRVLPWIYGFGAAALVGVGSLPPLAVAVATLFGAMMVLGMGNGAIFQMVPQRFREDIGFVSGLIGAAGGVGGFLLPSLLGWFKDLTGSFGAGFLLFATLAITCVVTLLRHRVRWQASWTAEAVSTAMGQRAGRVRMEVAYGG